MVAWNATPSRSVAPLSPPTSPRNSANARPSPAITSAEKTALPGSLRVGQDLSNYGARAGEDINAIHRHLYEPRSVNPWSNMPSYAFLYNVVKIQGQPSNEAVTGLTGPCAPKPGYEVVPTEKAKALVAYLMSLNQSYPLPESPVANAK